ncbi:Ctf8p and Ctf18p associating protein [Tilletia horrida]|nr:Ctf8p and Ctf18p associating protein [Tilletia horrida]
MATDINRVSVLTAPAAGDPPSYLLLQVPKELLPAFDPPAPAADGTQDATAAAAVAVAGSKDTSAAQKRKRADDDGAAVAGRRCFTINGRHSDSAVLCTDSASYTIRQIAQSNSLLLLTPAADPSSGNTTLHLRANLETILELVPTVPRLARIPDLLRPTAYQGPEEEVELQARMQRAMGVGTSAGGDADAARQKKKWKMYTHRQLRSIVQASEAEFAHALREYRVIQLGSRLRLVASPYRVKMLKLIHAQLMLESIKPELVPVRNIAKALAEENNVPEALTRAALLSWYGHPVAAPEVQGQENGKEYASLRPEAIVRDMGLELLSKHRTPTALAAFLSKWKQEVGELFEDQVDVALLRGFSLLHPSPLPTSLFPAPGSIAPASSASSLNSTSSSGAATPTSATSPSLAPQMVRPSAIQYYPAALLPVEPAQRFAELFLTRPHWTQDELLPFLEDLAPGGSAFGSGSGSGSGSAPPPSGTVLTPAEAEAAAEKRRKDQRKAVDSLLMKFTRSRAVKLAEPPAAGDAAAAAAADTGLGIARGAPGDGQQALTLRGRKKAAAAAAAAQVAAQAAGQACKEVKVYSARMKY